jgi:DNA-binding transcriptional LysR family regulator
VAQSTVSRAIARLEQAVGVALFHRTGRSFSLTDAGTELLPRAHEVLTELGAFEQAAALTRGVAGGAVKLSLCHAFGRHVLLPGLLAWAERRPRLHLDVRFEERDLDPRAAGLDVVVRAGRPRDSEVHRTPLGDYGHVLVASPAWVQRHGPPGEPGALAHLPTVAMRLERVWSTWIFRRGREELRVSVSPTASFTDADALVDAACAGVGATVLPDYLASAPLRDGRLVVLGTDFQLPRIPVFAFHAPRRRLTALGREALETLITTAQEHAAPDPGQHQRSSPA